MSLTIFIAIIAYAGYKLQIMVNYGDTYISQSLGITDDFTFNTLERGFKLAFGITAVLSPTTPNPNLSLFDPKYMRI